MIIKEVFTTEAEQGFRSIDEQKLMTVA